MDAFIATNGKKISDSDVFFEGKSIGAISLSDAEITALREFFQAEADERLGRWRWPENPHIYVTAEHIGFVHVIDERDPAHPGTWERYWRDAKTELDRAAVAYFDAHPEPKPWHDAKPWESWVFTIEGVEYAGTVDEDFEFRDPRDRGRNAWISVYDTAITAGRCIWQPEVSS